MKTPLHHLTLTCGGYDKMTYHFKDLIAYLEHAEVKEKRAGKEKKQAEGSGTKKRKERKEKGTAEGEEVKTHKKAKTGKNKGKGRRLS